MKSASCFGLRIFCLQNWVLKTVSKQTNYYFFAKRRKILYISMTMNKIIKYSKGVTFSGKGPYFGFFIFFIGLEILFVLPLFIGLMMMVIGIILVINIQGVIVDYSNNQYKKYTDLIIFKTGSWERMPQIDLLVLTKF